MPTIFQWYQLLRNHYQLTVFQAVRAALWLALASPGSERPLPGGYGQTEKPVTEKAPFQVITGKRKSRSLTVPS